MDFEDLKIPSGEMELSAIWLSEPVKVKTLGDTIESRHRIAKGNKIRVEKNVILDVTEDKPATHEIYGCFGTLNSSMLRITVWGLDDQCNPKLSAIRLK